jgi:predicted nucleotidyltransferase
LGFVFVVGVECLPIFQQSVDAKLYEWLLKEQKRRKARSVQEVIRQILREARAKAEAEGHGGH